MYRLVGVVSLFSFITSAAMAQDVAPAAPSVAAPTTAPAAQPSVINCDYHPDSANLNETVLKQWVQQAATQAFRLHHNMLDDELNALKACFTDPGWRSFEAALEQSGNIDAIRTKQLMVDAKITGDVQVSNVQSHKWTASIPLDVVYQNHDESLTQALTVALIIGEKPTGGLGIMQIIASPRLATDAPKST